MTIILRKAACIVYKGALVAHLVSPKALTAAAVVQFPVVCEQSWWQILWKASGLQCSP